MFQEREDICVCWAGKWGGEVVRGWSGWWGSHPGPSGMHGSSDLGEGSRDAPEALEQRGSGSGRTGFALLRP